MARGDLCEGSRYYATVKESVEIVDLRDLVPLFKSVNSIQEEQATSEDEPA